MLYKGTQVSFFFFQFMEQNQSLGKKLNSHFLVPKKKTCIRHQGFSLRPHAGSLMQRGCLLPLYKLLTHLDHD